MAAKPPSRLASRMVAAFNGLHERPYPAGDFRGGAEVFHVEVEKQILVKPQIVLFDKRRMDYQTAAIERLHLDRLRDLSCRVPRLAAAIAVDLRHIAVEDLHSKAGETFAFRTHRPMKAILVQPFQQMRRVFLEFEILVAEHEPGFFGIVPAVEKAVVEDGNGRVVDAVVKREKRHSAAERILRHVFFIRAEISHNRHNRCCHAGFSPNSNLKYEATASRSIFLPGQFAYFHGLNLNVRDAMR